MHDLDELIERFAARVEAHALGEPGAYARWIVPDAEGRRDLGANPYGCADAAHILYTLRRFPRGAAERRAWVETLQAFQDPESGLFREETHDPLHTTAHCAAALELFDVRPRHPLHALAPLREPAAMERFLDALDWAGNPWIEAHKGAGLYAALWLAGEASPEWQERYFAWLDAAADPRTGLFRQGCVKPPPEGALMLFPNLAGTFHYLFNMEHAGRGLRHPEALVDTCLQLLAERWFPLARFVGFAEIDWVYCLHRAARQCDRAEEAVAALRVFADEYLQFLWELDFDADEGAGDLHRLFGALCALAELQNALPGQLKSERPLRLVLDRRPFI